MARLTYTQTNGKTTTIRIPEKEARALPTIRIARNVAVQLLVDNAKRSEKTDAPDYDAMSFEQITQALIDEDILAVQSHLLSA